MLLYESSESMVASYRDAFQKVFASAGYNADIFALTKSDKEFADEDLCSKRYFDAVISDVSFGETVANTIGLGVLTEIKKRHPGIFTIAYTVQEITYNQCVETFVFDLFVGKIALNRPEYRDTVAMQIQAALRVNVHGCLANGIEEAWPGITAAQLIDLTRVVRKITFTGPSQAQAPTIREIRLTREEGGYSDARVFHLDALTDAGFDCVRTILKVATVDRPKAIKMLREESSNYKRYVRWYLPYNWRPELIAEADEGSMSAICYALVSAWNAPPRTLTHWLQNSRLDAVDAAIKSIFDPSLKRWYDHRNLLTDDHIAGWYLNHWFENAAFNRHDRVLAELLNSLDAADREHLQTQEFLEQNVGAALFGRNSGRFGTCLVHGDLNTSNVFLCPPAPTPEEFSEVAFIDFASTGRGPVFHDFVVFEVSLRLYYGPPLGSSLRQSVDAEVALLDGTDSGLPYQHQVTKLRQFAQANFTQERFSHYVFGIAAFSLSLLTASNLNAKQRSSLAASIFASLRHLRRAGYWDQKDDLAT